MKTLIKDLLYKMLNESNDLYSEYKKTLSIHSKLEKEIEILDRQKDPQADILRLKLDALELKLSDLSNKMENNS